MARPVRGRHARYRTGNPWPEQPPYDEIGEYAGTFSAERLARVRAGLARLDGLAMPERGPDVGVHSLIAAGIDLEFGRTTCPRRSPSSSGSCVPGSASCASGRRCPRCGPASRSGTGGVVLRLEQRGERAFAVADDRIEVRARDEGEAEWSRSPLPLLRQEPRVLAASGEQTLEIPPPAPGRTLRLLIGLTWTTEDGPVPGWILPEPLEGAG